MKILCLMGYFELPTGFKGKLSDALREFAIYHERVGLKNKNRNVGNKELSKEELKLNKEFSNMMFGRFLDNRKKFNNKVTMGCSVSEYVLKDEKGEWKDMDNLKGEVNEFRT